MKIERIKLLEEKVLYALQRYPATRNDDALLTFHIIHAYLPDEMMEIGGKWFISTEALKRVREDQVSRVRRKIQNPRPQDGYPGRFMPTDPAIRKQRAITEESWEIYSRSMSVEQFENINN